MAVLPTYAQGDEVRVEGLISRREALVLAATAYLGRWRDVGGKIGKFQFMRKKGRSK